MEAIVHLFGINLDSHCLRPACSVLFPVPSSLGTAGVQSLFPWFLLVSVNVLLRQRLIANGDLGGQQATEIGGHGVSTSELLEHVPPDPKIPVLGQVGHRMA